jgi:hypothetical protein
MAFRLASIPTSVFTAGLPSAVIGSRMAAFAMGTTLNAGPFYTPWRVPLDLDRAAPIDCYADFQCLNTNALANQIAVLVFGTTLAAATAIPTERLFTFNLAIPNPWTASHMLRVLLDDGSGHTIPANTVAAEDLLGFQLQRTPGAPADNFTQSLKPAAALTVRYKLKSGAGSGCCHV